MIDSANKIIYSNIKQELNLLFKIVPDNENLIKLDKAVDYFKDDKEGLLIIRHWLKEINNSIEIIKNDWRSKFSLIIKKILVSIKYD